MIFYKMSFGNIKKNKVAGPQFVSNVRFDDYHIAECRGQVGSAGTSSTDIPAAREEEVYDVKEGELLVCKRNGSMYTDGYAHAFSVVNGYPNTAGMKGDELKEKILQDVAFLGIAETEYKHSALGSWSEQGFVAVTGGVKTILNESTHDIYPGMKLMLDIDLTHGRKATREKGIPRSKVRFTVKPAGDDCALIAEALRLCGCAQSIGQGIGQKDGIGRNVTKGNAILLDSIKKQLKDTSKFPSGSQQRKDLKKQYADLQAQTCGLDSTKQMQSFLQSYRLLNERVIGRAYSYARPGERFEIGLGVRHAY